MDGDPSIQKQYTDLMDSLETDKQELSRVEYDDFTIFIETEYNRCFYNTESVDLVQTDPPYNTLSSAESSHAAYDSY